MRDWEGGEGRDWEGVREGLGGGRDWEGGTGRGWERGIKKSKERRDKEI